MARVFTSDEVSSAGARNSKDPQIRAAALSYFPGRSGDLLVLVKENWLLPATGTTHGTLYDVRPARAGDPVRRGHSCRGPRRRRATPADLAVTVASMVGVKLPSPDGRVLTGALKK